MLWNPFTLPVQAPPSCTFQPLPSFHYIIEMCYSDIHSQYIQVTQIEIFSRDFLDFKYKNASLSAVPYPIQDCDNTSSTITYLGIQPNCTSMATRACVMHLIMEGIKAASVKPLCFHQMTFHNHGRCEIKQCSYVSDMWTGFTPRTHTHRETETHLFH